MDASSLDQARLFQALSAIVVVGVLGHIVSASARRRKMPPGPSGLPLLGNIFQIPISMPWFKFTEWSRQYGPIFTLDVAGQPVVVLNTHKVAADLFDRRSSIYSDRPRVEMAGEILTGGYFLAFIYGNRWRRMRRAVHDSFSPQAAEQYRPMQTREARLTVLDLLSRSEHWQDDLRQMIASNVLTAVYGWPRVTTVDKPIVERVHAHLLRLTNAALPGRYLVDAFPVLRHLPTWLAKWKRDGLEWHAQETEMFEEFNEGVRGGMAKGESPTCFVENLVENEDQYGLTKKEAAWVAGAMITAGLETTSTSMKVFVLAMVLYPEVMRKAQAQIDAVVGHDRPPTFEDWENLSYIRAIVKEVLRWRPVTPLAGPHRATEDDWYEGYFILKGTTVIANVWGMHHDPIVYPEPEHFRPERFLDPSGTADVAPPDTHEMGHVSFGFGRRICVGMHFANQALFTGIATVLWALDIRRARDADGSEAVPDPSALVDAGFVVGPVPFRCEMAPRFPDAREVLELVLDS